MVKTVIGWSRDNAGHVVDWHKVDVANCVTCAKRNTTQNYVLITEKEPTKGLYSELLSFLGKFKKDD